MRKSASEILNELEMRVARLERTSARPSMSPRRQVEEGLFDYEDENPHKSRHEFEAFELNKESILNFVHENLIPHKSKKVVAVSVDAFHRSLVNVWVKTIEDSSHQFPEEYTSYSFDATVDSKGNVSKIVPDEEHDLNHAQYKRIERKPVDVSIDFESLQRAFPGYLFKKSRVARLERQSSDPFKGLFDKVDPVKTEDQDLDAFKVRLKGLISILRTEKPHSLAKELQDLVETYGERNSPKKVEAIRISVLHSLNLGQRTGLRVTSKGKIAPSNFKEQNIDKTEGLLVKLLNYRLL